jgi:hypothetical protein
MASPFVANNVVNFEIFIQPFLVNNRCHVNIMDADETLVNDIVL